MVVKHLGADLESASYKGFSVVAPRDMAIHQLFTLMGGTTEAIRAIK